MHACFWSSLLSCRHADGAPLPWKITLAARRHPSSSAGRLDNLSPVLAATALRQTRSILGLHGPLLPP
eukprot:1867367-Pyramimonas_sp.AAC.1